MSNTDTIICTVYSGIQNCFDYHASGHSMPSKDSTDNLSMVRDSLTNFTAGSIASYHFTRKMTPSDSTDKQIVGGEATRVAYAFGTATGE